MVFGGIGQVDQTLVNGSKTSEIISLGRYILPWCTTPLESCVVDIFENMVQLLVRTSYKKQFFLLCPPHARTCLFKSMSTAELIFSDVANGAKVWDQYFKTYFAHQLWQVNIYKTFEIRVICVFNVTV